MIAAAEEEGEEEEEEEEQAEMDAPEKATSLLAELSPICHRRQRERSWVSAGAVGLD